ncbi:hypothetical protein ACHAXS_013217 [Conticribra weissflogii]
MEIRRRQSHRRRERERQNSDSVSSALSSSSGSDETDGNDIQKQQQQQQQQEEEKKRIQQQQQQQQQSQQPQRRLQQLDSKKKEAAILLPLCTVRGTPSILFTRRSAQLSSHASQISFPGGYFDEELDAPQQQRQQHQHQQQTLTATNQPPPFLTILGQTQPVPQMSGHKVTPIVASINYDLPPPTSPTFHALFPGNPDEVDWIFTVPIVELMRGETSEPLRRWSRGDTARYGGKEGDKVWGLTASVLRPILYKVLIPVFGEEGLGVVGKEENSILGITSKL